LYIFGIFCNIVSSLLAVTAAPGRAPSQIEGVETVAMTVSSLVAVNTAPLRMEGIVDMSPETNDKTIYRLIRQKACKIASDKQKMAMKFAKIKTIPFGKVES